MGENYNQNTVFISLQNHVVLKIIHVLYAALSCKFKVQPPVTLCLLYIYILTIQLCLSPREGGETPMFFILLC